MCECAKEWEWERECVWLCVLLQSSVWQSDSSGWCECLHKQKRECVRWVRARVRMSNSETETETENDHETENENRIQS